MAPMHPASSRAIATVSRGAGWPRAPRGRERVPSLPGACQRLSWSSWGCVSRRRCQGRLPFAGEREAQAPSPSARRAWGGPAWVLEPWWRRSPEAWSAGIRPRHCLSARGGAQRVRAPRSAPMGTATLQGTPRRACRAAPTACQRQAGTGSWRAWARRQRRADHCREPRARGGAPMGGAHGATSVSEQESFEAQLRVLKSAEGIFTGPAEVAYGFVFHLGDRDRGEVARACQPGHWPGVSPVCFDAVTGLFGHEGGRHDPAVVAFFP
jgi:hypothetical protein